MGDIPEGSFLCHNSIHDDISSKSKERERKRTLPLIEAMQEFVDRCERGEIRSKYTYSKFKVLLETYYEGDAS